jgi:hypothetical protein
VFKCERNRERLFKIRRLSLFAQSRNAGGAVNNQNATFADDKGFTTEDILWAVGIWSVILGLSPVIVFYMLMVG